MNVERLIERISDITGNEWDEGTSQNEALSARVRLLLTAIAGSGRAAAVRIVACFIEDAMNVDADDDLMERIELLVAEVWA